MYHARSSESLTTLSLVKSREMLDKLTHQISQIESNRQNNKVIQSIQYSSKKIQNNLDHKIQQNFNLILNAPTLMPFSSTKADNLQKQNTIPTILSSLEGAKALMHHYWDRNKKTPFESVNKTSISKTFQSRKSDNKLPQINPVLQEFKIAAFIRNKEKEKEFNFVTKEEQQKQQFHISIKIVDYRCQNDSKNYLKFQKTYYKRWEEIESVLKAIEKFCFHYKLSPVSVETKLVFELIDRVRKGQRMSAHDLLGCCDNSQKISEQNCKKAGIRFYEKKGMIRALIKIQSQVRKFIQMRRYKKMHKQWKSAVAIQRQYRCYALYKQTKQRIFQRQMQKLSKFQQIQKQFTANYRKKQMQTRVRYEIHIPSHNMADWQKMSIQKYIQKQNSQLCRIFKMADDGPLTETKIIYISPLNLSKEILNYYKKLLQLGSQEKIDHRLTFITPQQMGTVSSNLSLTQQIYYCSKTIKKIKKIIKNNYAFIVPSTPSNDYIHLCTELNVPLYSSSPQKLLYLSTKSGCKNVQQSLTQSKDEGFSILPYSIDIYNESSLLNELTNLIFRYPYVKRWILKIDNQIHSRGVAFIDISKIVSKQLLDSLREQIGKNQQKVYREQIYSILQNSLVLNRQERIVPIDKEVYCSQEQYLKYYYTRGGIIQASINNFQTDLQNSCFAVEVEPDGEWKFICSYFKITNKNKAIGAFYDSNLIKPPLQIQAIVHKIKQQKLFGHFTLQFLSIPQHCQKTMKKTQFRMLYLNSIECSLDKYCSAHYLKKFISKESNALFIPILQHPNIKQLRIQTFFHLCRLQNISFDIQKKIGNVFTFVDGLQSSCIGMMSFNPISKEDCYAHTAEVLQFLNSKLKQGNNKDVPASFFAIKNSVNGFLNRNKKARMQSQKTLKR